jgi:uncharacterized protein (DUF2141 family)
MRNKLVILFLFLIPGTLFIRCARPGSLTGGPKDITPPEARSAIPPNRTINFDAKKITISFNEFLQLKDPAKEIFISPPMKLRPEFRLSGKNILVEFQEGFIANSTYTINFGNSIADFSEGNILTNFEYVFSTGDHIDSLSITGKVVNAFNEQPEAEIIAMLYADDNDTIAFDSLPLKVPPRFASKTTKDGYFSINNLSPGQYMLVALQDLNNNYIFDLPNERFAFLDSLILLTSPEPEVETNDSIGFDTIISPSSLIVQEAKYTLRLFEELDSTQRLLSKKLIGSNLLQYIFSMPVDTINISMVNFPPDRPDWYLPEFNKTKDTLNFWLRPGLPDTIRVRVSIIDSIADTTRFYLHKTVSARPGKRKEAAKETLTFVSTASAGYLDLNTKLYLLFPGPILNYNPGMLTLYTPSDTVIPSFTFTDSLQRIGEVSYKWLEKESYKLLVEDSAFCDLSGLCNDSSIFVFKVKSLEDYGVLIVDINLPEESGQYIIQLMDDKEKVIQEKIIVSSGLNGFEYLKPGNYKLKAIFDSNSNGKWDTGNYKKNVLPELVEYYPLPLSIRANWDLQEEWKLK